MAHVIRFMIWSIGLACIAWFIRLLSHDDVPTPETLVSRLRKSGF